MPRVREPGQAEAPIEQPMEVVGEQAAVVAELVETNHDRTDPRTPGLKVLSDGQVEYAGKTFAVPFMTTAGCIVPPIWPKTPDPKPEQA
jgi:hypothetical protein